MAWIEIIPGVWYGIPDAELERVLERVDPALLEPEQEALPEPEAA